MITITVWVDETKHEIEADQGENLRKVLLRHDFSPYTRITSTLNCGGRGLCATCGVWQCWVMMLAAVGSGCSARGDSEYRADNGQSFPH